MGFLQTTIVQTKTANFTACPAAAIYLIDATAGNVTATLPPAGTNPNTAYEFRRLDSSGHTVTVAAAADSAPTPAIADTVTVGTTEDTSTTLAAGVALRLVSDGAAGWYDVTSTAGGGGGGSVTATTVTTGTPADMNLGSVAGVPLVIAAAPSDTNDQSATAVIGCDDSAYGPDGVDAYSGSGYGLYGRSISGGGVRAISDSGAGLAASSNSGTAVTASSGSGVGLAAVSNSNTGVTGGSTTQDGVQGTGGRYGGSFIGTVAALCARGLVEIRTMAEPATPSSGAGYLYLDSADNVLKFKGSDGTVHALW